MARQPYMQFYVGDWRRSTDVQSLPYSERGIWFEMLCLMHDSPHRGELSNADGTPMADSEIARLLGLSRQDFSNALNLLLRKGVTERNKDGALINRRMVRERLEKEAKSRAGKAGADSRWGSNALAELWHASDSEVCLWKKDPVEDRKKLRTALDQWQEYRKRRAESPKDWRLYWDKQIKFLSQYPARVAVEIIDASIRNNWQGLFPPKHQTNGVTNGAVPVWQQIKAVESLLDGVNKELRAIPNPSPSVFPADAKAAEARRQPLRERKANLTDQLNRLKEQQAEGNA